MARAKGESAREYKARTTGGTLNYKTGAITPKAPVKLALPKAIAKQSPTAKIMSAQKSQFETLPNGASGPVVPKSYVKPAQSPFAKLDAVKSYTAPKFDYSKAKSVPNLDRSVADPLYPTDEEKKKYTDIARKEVLNPDNFDPVKHSSRSVFTQKERNESKPTIKETAVSRLRSIAEIPVGLRTLTGQLASKTASIFGKKDLSERITKNYEKASKDKIGQFAIPKTAGEEQAMAEFDSMSSLAVPARGGQIAASVGRIVNRAGKAGVSPQGISKIMAAGEKGAFQSVPKMASNRFGINTARAAEGDVAGASDAIPRSVPKIASEIPLAQRVTQELDNVPTPVSTPVVREAIASGDTVAEVAQKIPRIPNKNTRRSGEIFTEVDDIGRERVFSNVDDGGPELKKVEIGEVDDTGKFVEKMAEDGRPMTTVVEEGMKNIRDGKRGAIRMESAGGNIVMQGQRKKGLIGLNGIKTKMTAAQDRKLAKTAEDANIQDHLKTKIEKLKAARDAATDPETRFRLEAKLNDEISILNDYPKMGAEDRQFFKERSLKENPQLSDAITNDYQMTRETPTKKGIFGGTLKGFIKNPLVKEDPLLKEARKYKTPEEFGNNVFYRGIGKNSEQNAKRTRVGNQFGEGLYASPNKDFAGKYGDLHAVIPKKGAKFHEVDRVISDEGVGQLYDRETGMPIEDIYRGLSKYIEKHDGDLGPAYADWAKEEGFDGIKIFDESKGGKLNEVLMFDKNANQIIPLGKSQLTDLYNKAHGGGTKTLKGFVGGSETAAKEGFDPQSYVKEMVKKQKDAEGGKGLLAKVGSFLGEFKKKIIETNAPIEDVIAESQKKFKFEAIPRYDMTNQIDRVYRAQSMAGQFAKENGLEGVIKKVDDLDTFDQYLIAKHGQSLEAQGIKTGRDSARDQQLIAAFGEKYKAAEKTVRDYSHKLLDYAVESGLIAKNVAEDLKVKYPDYVPYQRIFGEEEAVTGGVGRSGVANLGKQSVVQRIKGSEREVQSPMQSFLEKTTDAFVQGEKNKAAQILASHHNIPGNPFGLEQLRSAENVQKRIETLTELRTLYKGVFDESGKVIEAGIHKQRRQLMYANKGLRGMLRSAEDIDKQIAPLLDEAITRSADFDAKSKIDPIISKLKTLEGRKNDLTQKAFFGKEAERAKELDNILAEKKQLVQELRDELKQARDIPKTPGDNTITFFKNGVKEVWKVNKDVAEAAKAMNVQQIGLLGKIFAAPIRVAKLGITGINLPFVAANAAKDLVSAFVNSKNTFRGLINMPQALFETVGHQKLYQEMVREGAMQTSFDIARNQVSPTIRNTRGLLGNKGMERVKYLASTPAQFFRAVEDIVGRSEELNRISQYKAAYDDALKRGMKPIDARAVAARAARETTTNFARKGEWGSAMNVLVLYLNAGIQGSRTLTRSIIQRPVATATKIISTVAMPLAITTAWNLKDPERKAAYEDIPEYEKENNMILIPENPTQDENGKWNVIKVPITPGLSNMVQPVRYALERSNGLDPQSFAQIANVLSGSVSPVQVPVDEDTTRKTISQLMPQAIKPTMEAVTNKDSFTGAPIIPRRLEGLKPELQVKDNTSGTAMILGKQLNASPLQIEHFIKSTFGSVGLQGLNASDKVLAKTGKISPEDIGGQEVMDAIFARFGKAGGGAIEQKQWANEAQAAEEDKSQKYIEKQKFQPTYDKIQKLYQEGKEDEASKIIDSLSDDEVAQFKKTVTAEKKKVTENNKRRMQPVADDLSQMMQSGDEEGVNRIIDSLSDEEVHALGLVLGIKL